MILLNKIKMDVLGIVPKKSNIDISELSVFKTASFQLKPFDTIILNFIYDLSKSILKNTTVNRLPEIVSLAFWLRESNMNQIKAENIALFESKKYKVLPVGKVFHICPTNVDTMFIYSMVVSLLMGNKNILRVSSRMKAPQIFILFEIINTLLEQDRYRILEEYINIVQYGREEAINEFISQNVNARIIWGGDETVQSFKELKTVIKCRDIMFPDRISTLIINAESLIRLDDKELDKFVHDFFADAYTFDQLGCSSPQEIFFVGNQQDTKVANEVFITKVSERINNMFTGDMASIASLKLNHLVLDAMDKSIINKNGNNIMTIAELDNSQQNNLLHSCGAGLFYIKNIENIETFKKFVTPKVQTLTYWGFIDLVEFVTLEDTSGIDRIVPLGKSLEFNYIWDGYNLLEQLSRRLFKA